MKANTAKITNGAFCFCSAAHLTYSQHLPSNFRSTKGECFFSRHQRNRPIPKAQRNYAFIVSLRDSDTSGNWHVLRSYSQISRTVPNIVSRLCSFWLKYGKRIPSFIVALRALIWPNLRSLHLVPYSSVHCAVMTNFQTYVSSA